MKRILLIVALALGCAVAATAQTRTMGARFGGGTILGADFSYQYSMGEDFIEANAGIDFNAVTISATGIYNFMISHPQWTKKGTVGFYAGPGASLGGILGTMHAAVVGQVGLEYFFEGLPLQLSLDVRPSIGFSFAGGPLYWSAAAGFGVRYSF